MMTIEPAWREMRRDLAVVGAIALAMMGLFGAAATTTALAACGLFAWFLAATYGERNWFARKIAAHLLSQEDVDRRLRDKAAAFDALCKKEVVLQGRERSTPTTSAKEALSPPGAGPSGTCAGQFFIDRPRRHAADPKVPWPTPN